jgi:ubiquinone/menaquinone biosynthesis C-methylase UbiE
VDTTTIGDSMTQTLSGSADLDAADATLKAKHRAMWALGDYDRVVRDMVEPLGPVLVEAAGIAVGDRVLDIAAGSGNASIPAALAGAQVTAMDLVPELLAAGQRRAADRGLNVTWETGDAEALTYADASFDVVISCLGVMFAPHHEIASRELLRVCRAGGTIGLLSWTPVGFIGQMFATMKPYAPPAPPGSTPPPLWGDEAHVRELLGEGVVDVRVEKRTLRVTCWATAEEFREFFKTYYGPTIAVYRAIGPDRERAEALDRDLADLARRFDCGTDTLVVESEYLVLIGRRAG